MNQAGRFLSGFFFGSLIGAIFVLLFTPKSGESVRQQIRGGFESVRTEVNTAAVNRRIELEKQLGNLRSPRKSIEL